MQPKTPSHAWPFLVALVAVLLGAAILRLVRLPELPLGLHYDEAANIVLVDEIARGEKAPIFIPSYTGKEVAFFYWAALWFRLLGATPVALRLSAALVGLATVAAAVWAARELLAGWPGARWIALLCGAFLASSFWHLVFSRYGFRAVTQPLLQALTVAALWRGLRLREGENGREQRHGAARGWPWLLVAGLCCGLTAYTYLAARAFPMPLALALLAFLLLRRSARLSRTLDCAFVVLVAALVLAPLAIYWLRHPGSFLERTGQVAAADWPQAWAGIKACLGMFFLRGDPYIRFNLPLRPIFDPLTAAFFLAGIGLVAWRAIRPPRDNRPATVALSRAGCVFLLVSLPVMLLPSALAVGDITPSNLRAIGLLPFVYVFPAVGLAALVAWGVRLVRRVTAAGATGVATTDELREWPHLWQALVVVALAALLAVPTVRAYFYDWASSPELYEVADGDLVDVAAYLNRLPPPDESGVTLYVASRHYRHPTLASLARDYPAMRWLVGGRTLVLPAAGDALLIFPHSASKDLDWVRTLLPAELMVDAPASPNGEVAFTVYRVPASFNAAPSRIISANLGGALEVLGYDVLAVPAAGEEAEIVVWSRVLAAPALGDYGPLARLTDQWGFVWGESSPFHYPSEQWQPGERVVDHLSIPVERGAPPGEYRVRFSLHSPQTGQQLPVLDGAGRYAGTWVELPLRLGRANPPADDERAARTIRNLNIRQRIDADVEGLTLLGVNLDSATVRPGAPLYLTLFWRAQNPPRPDYTISLLLGDQVLVSSGPVHGTYPFSEWVAGEIVADRYGLRLPRDFAAGAYALELRLDAPTAEGGPRLQVGLGILTVQMVERSFDVPPVSHPFATPVALGGQVELLGYQLDPQPVAPGGTLALTLVWRGLAEMEQDYTVFVHLLAPDGAQAGQGDAQPLAGTYPTSLWLPGEVVADRHEIVVSSPAVEGAYRLQVGMYVAETGARLSVPGAEQDAILLEPVLVANP